VTPIQNAVEMRDMGTATSATTFGRQLGGAIGTALFGAILANQLPHYLEKGLTANPEAAKMAAEHGEQVNFNNVDALHTLLEPLKSVVLTAYTHAITDIFLAAIPIIVVALIVVFFLKEIPLRTRQLTTTDNASGQHATSEAGEDVAAPVFSGH